MLDVNGRRVFVGLLLDKVKPINIENFDTALIPRCTHWHWMAVVGDELRFFDICDWTPIPIEPVKESSHS